MENVLLRRLDGTEEAASVNLPHGTKVGDIFEHRGTRWTIVGKVAREIAIDHKVRRFDGWIAEPTTRG
jgi:hypothetical protein